MDQPISARNISKKIIISLLQQLWDQLGFFLDIFRVAMKILNNKVCLAMPGNVNCYTPIQEISEALAQTASEVCNKQLQIDHINPMRRNAVLEGFEVSHLVCAKDGSNYCYSMVLYLIS